MQGRQIGETELDLIRSLLATHPEWNRTRLSGELSTRWNWSNPRDQTKDMAARTLSGAT